MSSMQISNKELDTIERAAFLLRSGELVAIPTETVYGLAANAYNLEAVKSIFRVKGRPNTNPLIVHIRSVEQLSEVAQEIPPIALHLAWHFWPGSLTLILKKKEHISDVVSANYDTVAVRVPNHPLTLALLNSLDFPLVAPSANRSNHISPTKPEHVHKSLKEQAPFVLDGGSCSRGLESTILGFEGDEVVLYRQGAIAQEEIEAFLGKTIRDASLSTKQGQTPGSSNKHYSPLTPMILVDKIDWNNKNEDKRVGYLILHSEFTNLNGRPVLSLSKSGDFSEAASNLYDVLHQLDELQLELIVAEKMPDYGLGKSINDRLSRAASK